MKEDSGVFDRLRARGEEVFTQVSNEIMMNPHLVKAFKGAVRGKQKLEEAVGKALKTMNVPTRREFEKALSRIEALEAVLSEKRNQTKAEKKRQKNRTTRSVKKISVKPKMARPRPALQKAAVESI